MQENALLFPQDVYSKYLANINNIRFTQREIDVIACLLGMRGTSKIASLLSIAPRTVVTHIRNIMLKLECNSREGIIDFIEKSGKFILIRKYYTNLLVQEELRKALKEIARIKREETYPLIIIYWKIQEQKNTLLHNLGNYLKQSGIHADIREYEGNLSIENLRKEKKALIFLLEKKAQQEVHQDLTGFEIIGLENQQSCYLLIFEILKKFIPTTNFEEIITTFKKKYETIEKIDIFRYSQDYFENKKPDSTIINIFLERILRKKEWRRVFPFLVISFIGIVALVLFSFIGFIIFFQNTSIKKNIAPYQQSKIKTQPKTWNLPRSLEHYTERKALTDMVWSKLETTDKKKTAVLAGLHGLGGVGKTILATHLIRNPKNHYEFRGWFSAETKDLLKADYFALGEKFHLFTGAMPDNLKLNLVKEWLENKGSALLVYDNAPDMDTLEAFLPDRGHIIITSRNYAIPGAIEIDVMKESEALELLAKLIPKTIQRQLTYQQEAKKLTKTLGYLPLAISQAGAYISENRLAISDYLKLYETNRGDLLRENSLPPGDKHEPVYVTWDMNIEMLRKSPHGDNALNLLNFISYCYSENIPKKLLTQYLYGKITNEIEIASNRVLNLLAKYSLIKVSPNVISIHRLVQEWAKNKHTKKIKQDILQRSAGAIHSIYPWENKTSKDIEFVRALIPHTESICLLIKSFFKDGKVIDLISILGDSYSTLGEYDKSKQFHLEALKICTKLFGTSHIKTANILYNLFWEYIHLNNYVEAKKISEKTLEIFEKYYSPDHLEIAKIYRCLSLTHAMLGNYVEARKTSEKVLSIIEKHYGPGNIETSNILEDLAWAHLYLGDYNKALHAGTRALRIREKHYGATHTETAKILRILGWVYVSSGHYLKSKQYFKRAYIIIEQFYGPDHIATSHVLHNVGWAFTLLGNYVQGKELLEKSLQIKKKYSDLDKIEIAETLYSIGWANFGLENYINSKLLFEEVLKIRNKYFGQENIMVFHAINSIGISHCYLGNHLKAKENLEKCSNMLTKQYGNNHIFTAISKNNLGNIHRILHDSTKSKKLLEEALDFFNNFYGPNNINVAIVLGNLGLIHGDLGNLTKKREYLEKAYAIFKKNLYPGNMYVKTTLGELDKLKVSTIEDTINNTKSLGYFIIF